MSRIDAAEPTADHEKTDTEKLVLSRETGFGHEVYQESDLIAGTYTVPRLVDKLASVQQRASTFRWVIAAIALILLGEQSAFATLLYTPILGDLQAKFHANNILWVITVGTLVGGACLPVIGKLGDRFGKKTVILVAVTIASIGCALCAVTNNYGVFLVGRSLSGVSNGFLILAIPLVREVFPPRSRQLVVSVAYGGTGLVTILGPLLSGWLVQVWDVTAPIWFQLVLGVIVGVLIAFLVPESPLRNRAKVGFLNAALIGLGATSLSYGISQLGMYSWGSWQVLVFIIAGIALLLGWWAHSQVSKAPLVSPALFKQRSLVGTVFSFSLVGAAAVAVLLLMTVAWETPKGAAPYAQGLDALQLAFWMIPYACCVTATGFIVGSTAHKVGYRNYMFIGAAFGVVGSVVLAFVLTASPLVLILLFPLAALSYLSGSAAQPLLLLASPPDQRSSVLAIGSSFTALLIGILAQVGYAILGSTGASLSGYRTALLVMAGISLVGGLFAFMITHGRRNSGVIAIDH